MHGGNFFQAQGKSLAAFPGQRLRIRDEQESLNTLLIKKELQGEQFHSDQGKLIAITPDFSGRFEAIDAAYQYRSMLNTPVPKISGTVTAYVRNAEQSPYAKLDNHGEYWVQLAGYRLENSCFKVRKAEMFAGENYGMHFPLKSGAEVLLSFIDGHPESPVLTGSVYNAQQLNIVKDQNPYDHILSSASGSKLCLSDQQGQEGLSLSHAENYKMSVRKELHQLEIQVDSLTEKKEIKKDLVTNYTAGGNVQNNYVANTSNINNYVANVANSTNNATSINQVATTAGVNVAADTGLVRLWNEIGIAGHTNISTGMLRTNMNLSVNNKSLEIGPKEEVQASLMRFLPWKWETKVNDTNTVIASLTDTVAHHTKLIASHQENILSNNEMIAQSHATAMSRCDQIAEHTETVGQMATTALNRRETICSVIHNTAMRIFN
ncbi:phage baseplate assembly protein V [Piscirickettsia litoralis]|uniref:Gp5/Type VI secretion system Vgr protein OB-fold domain-containing protein n=1 Tax=Piscirickettsia litoralis TaxID=1891921 RepID=A0ABX3A6S5_9GAMM|nr:phage baseplate assembly protein V [Piscirickettsia litoralis]ODN43343.1 hypothetical protein BGC07_10920 [Piscirickettsia litoralis]